MNAACPDRGQLQALLEGKLAEERQTDLGRHLDTCVDCQQTLEGLAGAGPDLAGAVARPPESALVRAMAELKGTPSEAATQAGPPGSRDPELAFLSASPDPDHLGRIGYYEIHSVLGRGGMGLVLKAFDPVLRRFVAIKVLGSHLAANPVHRQRFLREARSAAAVRHEHVVGIHAVDDSGALPFLVMEYVEGTTLQGRLDQGPPLQLSEILDLGIQLADGLTAAHSRGVIHRDIKPANVLLRPPATVLIADFGLARAVEDTALTQSGVIAGTPQYMAPEQARGEAIDHRADLFSLGSVLYALCTGRAPFQGGAAVAVLYQVCAEIPTPIREINPAIPEWLAAVVEKLQAKNPEDRFASAAAVTESLREYRTHLREPTRTARPPMPERPVTPAPLTFALPLAVQRALGREYRSRRTLWGLPLVHIASGIDPVTGKRRIAKGILAIGDVAIGVCALGGFSVGVLSLGGISLGLISIGGLSIGLLLALGGGAVGAIALGGGVIGLVAVGGGAIGYYALGGWAWGVHILDAATRDPAAVEFFTSWLGSWVERLGTRR